jgi:hypothetical protein
VTDSAATSQALGKDPTTTTTATDVTGTTAHATLGTDPSTPNLAAAEPEQVDTEVLR